MSGGTQYHKHTNFTGLFWTEYDFCIFSDCRNSFNHKFMKRQKISLIQQIQSLHLKNTLKPHMFIGMCSPFLWLHMQILNLCHRWHRCFHNPLKYLKWSVWLSSKYTSRCHVDIWQIKQMCVIVKIRCFYSFTNNSKSKQN